MEIYPLFNILSRLNILKIELVLRLTLFLYKNVITFLYKKLKKNLHPTLLTIIPSQSHNGSLFRPPPAECFYGPFHEGCQYARCNVQAYGLRAQAQKQWYFSMPEGDASARVLYHDKLQRYCYPSLVQCTTQAVQGDQQEDLQAISYALYG